MTTKLLMLSLGLAASLGAWAPDDEAELRRQALADEPCSQVLFEVRPGQSYEYRWVEVQDLDKHAFLVLRREPRRLLLELALKKKGGPDVVERRAWVRRNGQQRLLTESDGLAACETRLGVPLERLDAVIRQIERENDWKRGVWPQPAPKKVKKVIKKSEKKAAKKAVSKAGKDK